MFINLHYAVLIMIGLLFITGCNGQEVRQDAIDNDGNDSEFVSIFNGTDLTDWDGDSRFWSVENGMIVGETSIDNVTERNTFLIWDGKELEDFELKFKYRFVEVGGQLSGNSGIQIRSERFVSEEEPNLVHRVRGYQVDFAVNQGVTGNLFEERGRGRIIAPPGQRMLIDSEGESHILKIVDDGVKLEKNIVHTEWNDHHIYAIGATIRTHINGDYMHELIDYSPEARYSGILAFQLHTGPPMRIEFKDIELKGLN